MKKLCFLCSLLLGTFLASAQSNTVPINVCVIVNKSLTHVKANYNRTTGDTTVTVNGQTRKFSEVYPDASKDYAANASWYVNHEAVSFQGKSFDKYGLPRVLGVNEITKAGEYKGVNVYVEAGYDGPIDIIYIPVRGGCEFQPYERILPSCGKLTVTPSAWEVKSGETISFTAKIDKKGDFKYVWNIHHGKVISGEGETKVTVSTRDAKKEMYAGVSVYNDDCFSYEEVTIKIR